MTQAPAALTVQTLPWELVDKWTSFRRDLLAYTIMVGVGLEVLSRWKFGDSGVRGLVYVWFAFEH